jgi:sirohydrochlorin ferrochelatase
MTTRCGEAGDFREARMTFLEAAMPRIAELVIAARPRGA